MILDIESTDFTTQDPMIHTGELPLVFLKGSFDGGTIKGKYSSGSYTLKFTGVYNHKFQFENIQEPELQSICGGAKLTNDRRSSYMNFRGRYLIHDLELPFEGGYVERKECIIV